MLAKAYMMRGGSENLALAKPLLEEVLAAPEHGLEPNFADIFSTDNEMNPEIIFSIRYKGGGFGIGSPFWEYFAPEGSANKYLKVGTPDGNNNPTPEIMSLFERDSLDIRQESFDVYVRSATRQFQFITNYF